MIGRGASFALLGFDFRWKRSPKTGTWYPNTNPRRKQVIEVLCRVRYVLRNSRTLAVQSAVAEVNVIVRGWVNYFRWDNSYQALDRVKRHVELKVRRFAAKRAKRGASVGSDGVWTSCTGTRGLLNDYRVRYHAVLKVGLPPSGTITLVR
ncbi:group II intron maturase-specific domain-containing protein [Myxococcus sp. CA051A]|uniref:group II intron maturase-specific domain-containing protein n=1 Tax=Myxococcus sp. CA051A TaxID=2741739 RepID=UPI0020C5E0FC|nr:group II intron maturase-specific domain-containing protein [Myxococcus sp. CA051A]